MTGSPISLPPGYTARPATLADVAEAAALIDACYRATIGEGGPSLADKENHWTTPGLDLARDVQLIFAPGGRLVGLLEFLDVSESHTQPSLNLQVHPEYQPGLVGAYLLQWADRRAQALLDLAPPGAPIDLLASVDARERLRRDLLLAHGYVEVRTFWRMLLETDVPPPVPPQPAGIQLRSPVPGVDDRLVHGVIEEAFAGHWRYEPLPFDQWRHWNIEDDDFDPSLWSLALVGETAIGALLAWPSFHGDPTTGWISELGVLPTWRRQGIGRALIQRAFATLYRRGIGRVMLMVDTENTSGANYFYEQVGMRPAQQRIVLEKAVPREPASSLSR